MSTQTANNEASASTHCYAGFEQAIANAAQRSIVGLLAKGDWLAVDYRDKVRVPPEELRGVFDAVDMDAVRLILKAKLEQKIADSIFNSMATEIANDVKQVMSNTELREDCRAYLRTKMREANDGITA